MKSQKEIWNEEHATADSLPSLAELQPSSAVVQFVEWLDAQGVEKSGRAIDIGTGKGRNAIYLTQQGFDVVAVDYIQGAIDTASAAAEQAGVSGIDFRVGHMDQPWEFEDATFDFAVDCFSSIDIETKEGREVYRDEMLRTLKPGGLAFVAVVSTEDEIEAELLQTSPGPEPNSTVWPGNNKFQKNYTDDELREFYSDFEIVALEMKRKTAHKLNRDYQAANWWMVLRKPQ